MRYGGYQLQSQLLQQLLYKYLPMSVNNVFFSLRNDCRPQLQWHIMHAYAIHVQI